MTRLRLAFPFLSALIALLFVFIPTVNAQNKPLQKMTVEELLAKHLESLGPPDLRAKIVSRLAAGPVVLEFAPGGLVSKIQGVSALSSEGQKLKFFAQFTDPNYPGEQFVFDGTKAQVANFKLNMRSAWGNFMFSRSEVLQEGLIGGTLSTAWPLFNMKDRNAKLSYGGLKEVNGRQLHQLVYTPRKSGGFVQIRLYFDPETFRHVMTTYATNFIQDRSDTSQLQGRTVYQIAETSDTKDTTNYRMEETFSDFKDVNGLMLPTHWVVKYTSESANLSNAHSQGSVNMNWDIKVIQFGQNAKVPLKFEIE